MVAIGLPKSKVNTLSLIAVITMLCLVSFTGILPQFVIGAAVLVLSVVLMLSDDIYLAWPVMIFYYESLGQLFGMSIFRWYTFIYIVSILLRKKENFFKFKIEKNLVPMLVVYLLYCIFVLSFKDIRLGIFSYLDIILTLILVKRDLSDENKFVSFFKVYIVVEILSFVTGCVTNNIRDEATVLSGVYTIINRNNATFEDPNYMGYFFTIGIFSVVTLKPFKKFLNFLTIIVLYIMLLSSLSMTAIIVNIILWLLYVFLINKLKPKNLIIIIAVVVISVIIYNYALKSPDLPILGQMAARVKEKLSNISENDINAFTTNRASLAEFHLKLFNSQSLFKKLIGMNPMSTKYCDLSVLEAAAHNEYVDLLLNVGIIGTVIMISTVVVRLFRTYKNYKFSASSTCTQILMMKFTWILYAFTLTIFMDNRFMIPLFL